MRKTPTKPTAAAARLTAACTTRVSAWCSGGVIWAAGLTILGYFLGQNAFVQKNIELIAILIIAISLIPALVEWLRARRGQRTA